MRKTAALVAGGAAAVATAAGIVPAATATGASAASLPVIYSGMGGRWANAAVRPHKFVLGAFYYMHDMSWSRWTGTGAVGRGKQVACAGASGPCNNYRVTITLTSVKLHNGRKYFATMKVAGAGHKTYVMVMRNGFWQRR